MAKYWERRPEFEAVQLIASNEAEIRKLTKNDVAFSDKNCFLRINQQLTVEPLGIWLVKVRDGNSELMLMEEFQFSAKYELAIVPEKNSQIPIRGE